MYCNFILVHFHFHFRFLHDFANTWMHHYGRTKRIRRRKQANTGKIVISKEIIALSRWMKHESRKHGFRWKCHLCPSHFSGKPHWIFCHLSLTEKHILLIDIKFIGTCMVFWTYFVNQHDNYWVTNTTFTLYINLNCCHELSYI